MKYIASTIVRASDIGLNNYLFGGTLLRWLDEYGALFVYKYLKHTFVTYKIDKTYFLKPAQQGDCIDFYVTNVQFNKVSVNFDLVAKINNCDPPKQIINTHMTFVAISNENYKPMPKLINPMLFQGQWFELYIKQKMFKFMSDDENIYHNRNHVFDMLNQLSLHKLNLSMNDYRKLFVAICYHDAVHVANAVDNEQKSVETLKRDWGKIFDHSELQSIIELILSTKINCDYGKLKTIPNADLLHDLDMMAFVDYETMKNNDVKIRSEYSEYSTLQFYNYKLQFLNWLLQNGVFISKYYSKYNSIAKQNIKKYMVQLQQLIKTIKDNQQVEK